MENKKHCDICNKDVSSTNWSKHLKTKTHEFTHTAKELYYM
jgi:RNA polymerase subunit RPABC4/transcription elongation factor Spt4